MPTVDQRQTFWFYFFLVALIVGAFCAVGYWQSYDIQCAGLGKTWVWDKLPPHFECRIF